MRRKRDKDEKGEGEREQNKGYKRGKEARRSEQEKEREMNRDLEIDSLDRERNFRLLLAKSLLCGSKTRFTNKRERRETHRGRDE